MPFSRFWMTTGSPIGVNLAGGEIAELEITDDFLAPLLATMIVSLPSSTPKASKSTVPPSAVLGITRLGI